MNRKLIWSTLLSTSMFLALISSSVPTTNYVAEAKIPDQYIVVLRDDVTDPGAAAKDIAQKHGLGLGLVYGHALKGFSAVIPAPVLDKVKNDPRVSYVEQDQLVEAFGQTIPTGIDRIDADLSSTKAGDGSGSVDVDIAIIDTGIELNHPDLNVQSLQKTCVLGTQNANDDNGHGTHVAGIAAAKDNTMGVVGVAPGAKLYAVKVLDRNGSGFISWIICGVNWVTANASILDAANMSLGCKCHSEALHTAVKNSVAAGVTYTVAAGNSASDVKDFDPASYPEVITVSAMADSNGIGGGKGPATGYGADDTFATFSNFGSGVDLAAPGVTIFSTYKGQSYATLSGTSMASPHVVGAAALYVAVNGRDLNHDGKVNGSDVAMVQQGLINLGAAQGTSLGFAGDPDQYHEPLVYAAKL